MKGHELGALLAAFLAGALLVAVVLVGVHPLSTSAYVAATSNALTLLAAPSVVLAVGFGAWRRWHCRCAVPRCMRTGEHEVDGTLRKVCRHHHDDASHLLCRSLWPLPKGARGWHG